jgi:hypothetical protein
MGPNLDFAVLGTGEIEHFEGKHHPFEKKSVRAQAPQDHHAIRTIAVTTDEVPDARFLFNLQNGGLQIRKGGPLQRRRLR